MIWLVPIEYSLIRRGCILTSMMNGYRRHKCHKSRSPCIYFSISIMRIVIFLHTILQKKNTL